MDKHWETWVTFKAGKLGGFFNLEQAVRVYIDTPGEVAINNTQGQDSPSIATGDQIKIPPLYVVIIAVVAIFLLTLGALVYKKKKL